VWAVIGGLVGGMRLLDSIADLMDQFDAALEWELTDDPLLAPPSPTTSVLGGWSPLAHVAADARLDT